VISITARSGPSAPAASTRRPSSVTNTTFRCSHRA
jgi:hypothetical protein